MISDSKLHLKFKMLLPKKAEHFRSQINYFKNYVRAGERGEWAVIV